MAFQAASCTDFSAPCLPPPLNTKGGCPGSGGVALLKCEGLSGAALVQTSVSLTKRGAEGNEGRGLCNGLLSPPLRRSGSIVGQRRSKRSPLEEHKAEVWQD